MKPFEKRVWLSSPTMHGDEMKYIMEAYDTNWMSTLGANVQAVEQIAAQKAQVNYAVALSNCTAALHLCVKSAGERLYGRPAVGHGALEGKRVFCSDMTFSATLNPVVYEGGVPVFIDTDPDTWNMDTVALERAFALYPDVKLVVYAELYGFPGNVDRIRDICRSHGALLIEDAAESMGATLNGRQCGSFGDYGAISYNGNKIITGSTGGCLLTNDAAVADQTRKWSTQAREAAPWYQHTEIGYNYRMSNVVAGVVRGQYHYLEEHIARKKAIFQRYQEGFADLPITMNPYDPETTEPNFWLSCILLDKEAMCLQDRGDLQSSYRTEPGKTCPDEIYDTLDKYNAEGRPIWKPMHLQPLYSGHAFVKRAEDGPDVGADIFRRGLCLPSDIKMTAEEQDQVIEIVRSCFK
jgi:dTDP-4-amino-4,6-dideoxygalactose transaminase